MHNKNYSNTSSCKSVWLFIIITMSDCLKVPIVPIVTDNKDGVVT